MLLTEEQRIDCEQYVLRKSWRVHLTPQRSRRLVRTCLCLIPTAWAWESARELADSDLRYLQVEMEAEARNQVRNPAVLWLILRIVLPVLIKLVVEWWLSRRRAEA